MAKESIITVFRSTTSNIPEGLTFGELAYSDGNGQLFIGKNDGTSLWVGATITGGTIGNNQYLVPTQSAVKSYVEGVVGGGSVVNTFNGTGGAITLTGDGGAITNAQSNGANTIRARLATTGVTGVASFSSNNFNVADGAVSIKAGGVTNGSLENSSVTVSAGTGLGGGGSVALGGSVTLTNVGVLSLNGLTGAATITGDSAAVVGVGNNALTARLATTGATGVASFSSSDFTVASGAVSLTANVARTNVAQTFTQAQTFSGGIIVSGGATFGNISASNVVSSLNGLTGARTLTGDGGAVIGSGNTAITARLATTGATGVASFSSDNFTVTNGVVTIKDGGITNAELAASTITISTLPISLGGSVTITGTAGEIDVSAAASTITIGLPNDVTIAGNLTVNGTVVTTNVENFVVEDPLLMLGTGNSADSVDLGFYSKFVSGSAKYTGLFRDQSFSGKYRLFTDLTEEPTATVNTAHASYAMATLVARIDGGTF